MKTLRMHTIVVIFTLSVSVFQAIYILALYFLCGFTVLLQSNL